MPTHPRMSTEPLQPFVYPPSDDPGRYLVFEDHVFHIDAKQQEHLERFYPFRTNTYIDAVASFLLSPKAVGVAEIVNEKWKDLEVDVAAAWDEVLSRSNEVHPSLQTTLSFI